MLKPFEVLNKPLSHEAVRAHTIITGCEKNMCTFHSKLVVIFYNDEQT